MCNCSYPLTNTLLFQKRKKFFLFHHEISIKRFRKSHHSHSKSNKNRVFFSLFTKYISRKKICILKNYSAGSTVTHCDIKFQRNIMSLDSVSFIRFFLFTVFLFFPPLPMFPLSRGALL